jgi:hypothetical protein
MRKSKGRHSSHYLHARPVLLAEAPGALARGIKRRLLSRWLVAAASALLVIEAIALLSSRG